MKKLKLAGRYLLEVFVIVCIISLFEHYCHKLDMISVLFGFVFISAIQLYDYFKNEK